jgi:hypothetical protein
MLGTSDEVPLPNTMRPVVANSKRMRNYQALASGATL